VNDGNQGKEGEAHQETRGQQKGRTHKDTHGDFARDEVLAVSGQVEISREKRKSVAAKPKKTNQIEELTAAKKVEPTRTLSLYIK
jgi:hypothetical protein